MGKLVIGLVLQLHLFILHLQTNSQTNSLQVLLGELQDRPQRKCWRRNIFGKTLRCEFCPTIGILGSSGESTRFEWKNVGGSAIDSFTHNVWVYTKCFPCISQHVSHTFSLPGTHMFWMMISHQFNSVQFISVAQLGLTLYSPLE